jgi:integrase/recombinase XerD
MRTSKYHHLRKKCVTHLAHFIEWLQKSRYAKDTIRSDSNYTLSFLAWLQDQKIKETAVTYNDLMAFIDHSATEGDSNVLINRKLSAIRKYYEYLGYKGEAEKNPAAGLFIKCKRQTVPSNLLTPEELSAIYDNYQVTDLRSQRNKVMIGFLVYQGVTREELEKLEITHIKLNSGRIEVPSGKHSNSRILQLESIQILDLQEYIQITRGEILKAQGSYGTGRKPDSINHDKAQGQLFISMHGSDNIKNTFLHLVYALRRLNTKVTTAQQIRQSVITAWLKTKNLRTVQYMAGHRYVSSTERYQVNNLEDLYHQLEKLHPLSHQ